MTSEDIPLGREGGLLAKLYETTQVESNKVMCVEQHVRDKHGKAPLMDKTRKACKYGREKGKATTCGNCPYGVKLLEPRSVHDSHEVLKKLKEEQRKKSVYVS